MYGVRAPLTISQQRQRRRSLIMSNVNSGKDWLSYIEKKGQ